MKITIILCVTLFGSVLWFRNEEPKPISFKMDNREWFFPSTTGDAVTRHQLDYRPPGYYYKQYPNGNDVILYFHYADGDFDNKSQPKEALFSRKLHSYTFRFPNNPGVYDSLRQNLEATYHKKITLDKDRKDEGNLKYNSKEINFERGFITASDQLTVGIARGEKKIVVRYMYNLPLDVMASHMKGFIE